MVRRLSFAATLVATSLASASALAQAALEVSVSQPDSKAAVGTTVVVENPEIAFAARAVTDAQGKVRFAPLSTAGHYTVRVEESAEHLEVKAEALVLRSNFDRSLSLILTPRPRTTEVVTVTALANIGEMNATNAEVSSTMDSREMETLAVEGRDTTRALYRLPSVTQATGFYPEAPNVSINGANSLYANYVVDGLDNNENFLGGQKFAMPVGFTQQVTVLTSNYSTEFGRTGNGIFNLTSRSGGRRAPGRGLLPDPSRAVPRRLEPVSPARPLRQRGPGWVSAEPGRLRSRRSPRARPDVLPGRRRVHARPEGQHPELARARGRGDGSWTQRLPLPLRQGGPALERSMDVVGEAQRGPGHHRKTRRRSRRRRDLPFRRQLPGPRFGPGRGQDVLRGQEPRLGNARSSTRDSAGTTGGP